MIGRRKIELIAVRTDQELFTGRPESGRKCNHLSYRSRYHSVWNLNAAKKISVTLDLRAHCSLPGEASPTPVETSDRSSRPR